MLLLYVYDRVLWVVVIVVDKVTGGCKTLLITIIDIRVEVSVDIGTLLGEGFIGLLGGMILGWLASIVTWGNITVMGGIS